MAYTQSQPDETLFCSEKDHPSQQDPDKMMERLEKSPNAENQESCAEAVGEEPRLSS